MTDTVQNIPLRDIVESTILLRMVDTDSLDYLELYHSIKDYGFLNSISVRPSKKYDGKYELMEGMWRYSVARNLRLETIPCIIKHLESDTELLLVQIQGNAIRSETKPCEYAAHLDRILKGDPEMTLVTLAGKLRKNVDWIRDTLSLNRLVPKIKKSVNRGEIPVKSARLLAKIPKSWQEEFISQAKLLTYKDFSPLARSVIKEYKEAKRQGKMKKFYADQYRPHPFLRSMSNLLHEMKLCEEGAVYLSLEDLTPIEAWKRAIEWVLHMDPKGVEAQKERHKGMKEKVEKDAKRRKTDRRQMRELGNFGWDLTIPEK